MIKRSHLVPPLVSCSQPLWSQNKAKASEAGSRISCSLMWTALVWWLFLSTSHLSFETFIWNTPSSEQMSLVGYIWNKWGSVPSSPGKLARPLYVCLVDRRLGAFSSPSVDWCWGTLPLHTSAQKCSALIFQSITYQLLICTNLSSTWRPNVFPQTSFFFFLLLASLHGTGQLNTPGGISFIQPVLYTKACPFGHSSQKWDYLILLKCLSLLGYSC